MPKRIVIVMGVLSTRLRHVSAPLQSACCGRCRSSSKLTACMPLLHHMQASSSCSAAMLQTWRIFAGGLTAGAAQVAPKGDLVLVEVAAAETASTGGVLLPGSAQKKPTSGASAEGLRSLPAAFIPACRDSLAPCSSRRPLLSVCHPDPEVHATEGASS